MNVSSALLDSPRQIPNTHWSAHMITFIPRLVSCDFILQLVCINCDISVYSC